MGSALRVRTWQQAVSCASLLRGLNFGGLGFRVPYDVWGLFRMLVVSAAYIPSPAQTLKLLLFLLSSGAG